jgi:hypothetical protein
MRCNLLFTTLARPTELCLEAMELYQECLVIARKRLGVHHRDVAIMLSHV